MSVIQYVHYLPGGGLGDVFREAYFHNALGILKRWKNENPSAELTVVTMSHNPNAVDLLWGQSWIDEVQALRFPVEESKDWEYCYRKYPEAFEGKTELRFQLADRRSLYRADFVTLRPPHGHLGPVKLIPSIGCHWAVQFTEEERALVRAYPRRLVIHPRAGEDFRSLPDGLQTKLLEWAGDRSLVIGANYVRPGHGEESGLTLPPRVLVEVIAQSRGVIGGDSAPVYMASCLSVPRCMVYPEGIAFDRMMQGDASWDWYFGLQHPDNLFLKLPLVDAAVADVGEWVHQRLACA